MQALKGCTEISERYLEELIEEGSSTLSRKEYTAADALFKSIFSDHLQNEAKVRILCGRAEANLGLGKYRFAKFFYRKVLDLVKGQFGKTEQINHKLNSIAEQHEKWSREHLSACNDDLQDFQGEGYEDGYDIAAGIVESLQFDLQFPLCGPNKDNRFFDILPCQKTIVDFAPPFLGEYINANQIDIDGISVIATQYPLKHTRELFWKMILQKNCRIILNLSKSMEISYEDIYLPHTVNESLKIGPYIITLVNQELKENYNINYLCVETEGKKINFIQIHCNVWPDKGVPEGPKVLIQVLEELMNFLSTPEYNSPSIKPLFHCQAGAGRTGVALLLYLAMKARKAGVKKFNLCAKLIEMRQSRRCLVQSLEQYQYVIKCLMYSNNRHSK